MVHIPTLWLWKQTYTIINSKIPNGILSSLQEIIGAHKERKKKENKFHMITLSGQTRRFKIKSNIYLNFYYNIMHWIKKALIKYWVYLHYVFWLK